MILIIVKFVTQFDLCVKAGPSLTLRQDHTTIKTTVVGPVIGGDLKDPVIFQQVFIIPTIHNRYPGLELCLPIRREGDRNRKSDFIPTAGSGAVFPVRLMFEHKIPFTYIFIMVDDQMPQTDTGIKIKVLHGQRFLKDIPKSLLRVLQEKIGIEGEFTFRKTLGDAQLEFNVGVSRRRLVADRDTANKIIVLE